MPVWYAFSSRVSSDRQAPQCQMSWLMLICGHHCSTQDLQTAFQLEEYRLLYLLLPLWNQKLERYFVTFSLVLEELRRILVFQTSSTISLVGCQVFLWGGRNFTLNLCFHYQMFFLILLGFVTFLFRFDQNTLKF